MKKQNKVYRNIIVFVLSFIILINNLNLSFAESDTIYIDSIDDLVKFSQDASLDTYFRGKTIILQSDIDISSVESFSIPTFGGIFDGRGNTISGISISESGSIQGLFRYLQEDGVIKDLNVSASIKPSGSQNVVGGIVGNNRGSIEGCNFNGDVMGKNSIGGIAGINEATGTISDCSSSGKISGEHFIGGIVGQNLGTIFKSYNLSEINTSIVESTSNRGDINWSQINSIENVNAYTDIGGIAGLSSGYLQDCVNRGPVGYKYMGYNVGGIVGRQSGYLSNCKNYNTVLGRKDIGGIIGQVEPHLTLSFSEDMIQKLNHEVNLLQNIMNKSFANVRSSSGAISSEIDSISKSLDDTHESMEILSRGTLDHIDHITDTVNIASKRISYTLEEIIPILDQAEELSDRFNDGLKHIESGFDNLEETSNSMADALNEGKGAVEDLREGINLAGDAIYKTKGTLNRLLNILENKGSIKDIVKELEEALGQLEESFVDGSESISNILDALRNLDIKNPDWDDLLKELDSLSGDFESTAPSVFRLNREISTIISNGLLQTKIDTRRDLNDIFDDLYNSSRNIDTSIKGIYYSLSKLETTSQQSGDAFHDFSTGFYKFANASESMTAVLVSIRDLVDSLVSEPDIVLNNISSDYRQSGEDLFESIGNISSQVNNINGEIRDAGDILINDIEAINDQIFVVFNLLMTSIEGKDKSEYIEDISNEDVDDTSLGVVYKNQNYGYVSGDVNTGGIAGSMAIEYDLDPEDDIFKKGAPSLNFKYMTTAILKECINHGKVNSKKDYIGGIAGRMDLGLIKGCENYGDVESKEGDYVGGIAGASDTRIDNSFVLSSISGKNYLGGIAGYGNDISNSYTLVKFENGTEWIGSIAGKSEGEITNNYYVNDRVAAIDGISYSGKACPISYEELLRVDILPKAFTEFHTIFIADGEIIDEIPFQYGDSFNFTLLPDIPVKDGYDGHWEDFDSSNMVFNTTVEAIYNPLKTVLASEILRAGDGFPLLLAEGKFNNDVKLNLFPFDIANTKLPMKDKKILDAWNIELLGLEDEDEDYILRLLLPETKRKVTVWEYKDGGWDKLDSTINGSYIVFSMNGESGTFCMVEDSFPWMISIIISTILLMMLFFIKKNNKI